MKKSFDAVGWMRRRRVEIDRETEGLSWEDRNKRILESLAGDPLWERLKDRTAAPTPYGSFGRSVMAKETQRNYEAGAGTSDKSEAQ